MQNMYVQWFLIQSKVGEEVVLANTSKLGLQSVTICHKD